MKVNSREYQCRLNPALFEREELQIKKFFTSLSKCTPNVKIIDKSIKRVNFHRFFYDTETDNFADTNIKLRVRVYDNFISFTYKVIAADRYYVQQVPIDCSDTKAKTKLEEGIYAHHSMFSKQTTSRQNKQTNLTTIEEWCELFQGATNISPRQKAVLIASPISFITKLADISLNFNGEEIKASLELRYVDAEKTALDKVEFSWKHRNNNENYNSHTVILMRQFFQTINKSEWVDASIHFSKCQLDAGFTPLEHRFNNRSNNDKWSHKKGSCLLTKIC
ncbi:MAG: hypothetical protein ACR2LR_00840 [Hassallia sp.]